MCPVMKKINRVHKASARVTRDPGYKGSCLIKTWPRMEEGCGGHDVRISSMAFGEESSGLRNSDSNSSSQGSGKL